MGKFRSIADLEALSWSGSDIVHTLTHNGHLFLFGYSPRYRCLVSWSANAEKVLGVRDAAIAKDANLFLRHVHPDDRFLLMKDLEAALGGRGEYRATYRWIRPDTNEGRWLHCRANLIDAQYDHLFEGFIVDLTDEFTGAVRSLAGPDSISAVLAAFSTVVFTLDNELRLVRINRPKDRQLFRFGDRAFKAELFKIGRPLLACFSDAEQKLHFERKLQEVLHGAAAHYRTRIFEENTVYSLEAAPLFERFLIKGLLVNVSDITEIVRMERQLAELQKKEGLRLIAAGVTHNFNNCLQGILGHAAVIEGHPDDPKLVRSSSRAILEIVAKTSDLSRQLYKLGDAGAGVSSPLDLNLLVMAAVGQMQDLFTSGIRIAVALGSPSPALAGKEDLISAITAVVANAKESLELEGSITIKTFDVDLDDLAVEDLKGGHYAKLSISDTGRGMSSETRQRCLEPFFTTKDRDPRTGVGLKQHGLGLSGAYAALRNCGGTLMVESSEGAGTTVSMLIPAAPAAASALPDLPVTQSPEVLVVDDDPIVLNTTTALLNDLGYRCMGTSSTQEAVALLRMHHRSLKVVMLDVLMPGLSGVQALRRLRKVKPEIVVIGFSGAPPDMIQPLLDSGAAAVLRKPVTPGEVRAAIEEALKPAEQAA